MIDIALRVSRRRILQGMGALAASALLPATILPAFAATPVDNDFVHVSRVLTGRKMFPAEYSAALLAAFSKFDNAFAEKLSRLRAYMDNNAVKAADLKAKLQAEPSLADVANLPATILTGWYLGIVGSGEKAICVAYADALANQEVADVLRPPSYAYGAYGSWAAKPV